MERLLAIELFDKSRYLVKVPEDVINQQYKLSVITSLGFITASLANCIIDLDTRRFIKSRYVTDYKREVSQHEIDWFLSGYIQYVQPEELRRLIENLHRNR